MYKKRPGNPFPGLGCLSFRFCRLDDASVSLVRVHLAEISAIVLVFAQVAVLLAPSALPLVVRVVERFRTRLRVFEHRHLLTGGFLQHLPHLFLEMLRELVCVML